MPLNYHRAVHRALELWNTDQVTWTSAADGSPIKNERGFSDVHHPKAVNFGRYGAIIRAVEEQVGVGCLVSRQLTTVDNRLNDLGYKFTVPKTAGQALGHLGGSVKSDAKAEAARANGRKGGRPRKS